ncbi:chromosome segregation protein SMC [Agrilactobacillus yilanensis]|uniref:Chromosome partition protein Smc n=1 Tax=Agrilactobacillus yilanensis TaxID=2485997 RepID=A0ABW4J8Y5_9LACO|nr:chromosome segregation protein SMC [Agrilactobacillus yilanensis]
MPLSSLKIVGFKSFAEPTTLEFTQGVTGIVGPNGSGKSNITEAVRWAMGEQSAKGLRGERMSDVIFAGTQLRPALNLAEVTLNFDNRDRALKMDQDTLVVTRKIFRNGDSEFYINKKACRLKDITNLFLDSGLGKASFSIISQGQVEAIFNSRPEDRRTIIEETAGVHQYKIQKDAALQKLEKTGDNLNRVEDIINEIETQLEPLHEQSSLAKEYIEQKGQYDKLYQAWLTLNIDQKNTLKLATETQLETLETTLEKLKTTRTELSETLAQNQHSQTATDQQLDAQQQQLVTTTKALEALKGRVNATDQQHNQIGSQIQEYQTQLQAYTAEQQQLTTAKTALNAAAATLDQAAKDLKTEITLLQAQAGDSKDDLAAKLQDQNDHYLDLLQQQAQIRNSLVMLDKQNQVLENQIQRLTAQHQAKTAAYEKFAAQIKTVKANVQDGQKQFDAMTAQIETLQHQQQQLDQQYHQANQDLLRATEIYQKAQTKLTGLQELQNSFNGFYQGPKYILRRKAQIAGVQGAVAELITVPETYQTGIETVLNSQLQNIVVQSEAVAKTCIELLRKDHQGRATFLPLDSIKQFSVATAVSQQLTGQPGYLGTAADLVQVQPQYQKVAQHLLGTVLMVDTLEHGIQIARLIHRRYRIVTLAGDLLSTSGAMSGGALARNSSNLLQQNRQIETAKVQIAKMSVALDQKQSAVAAQKAQLTTLDQKIQTLQVQQKSDNTAYSQYHDELTNLENEADYAQRELKTLAYNLETSKEQAEDLQTEIAENQAQQATTVTAIATTNEKIAALKTALADYDEQRFENNTQLNQKLIQNSALLEQIKSSKLQLTTNQSRQTAVSAQIETLTQKIADLTAQNSNRLTSQAEVKQQLTVTEAKLKTTTAAVKKLQTQRQALQTLVAEQQQQLTRQVELVENTKTELATNRQKHELLVQQITEHLTTLETDYHETYQASKAKLKTLPSLALSEINQQLKLLKRGLDDIGPVNLNAIDDYSRTKARYDFLTQQRDDLLTAKETLMATIHELDAEVSQRFEQTFKEVSQAFSEIFPQMFGGGQARLSLTEPEDMLTTGVEINAQPPGKKLQRLSLLSGGERALTAITVLFAIIKVRPVPFCILDEVEASLDDANVDRYADFLKTYDVQTQFIVITHRKGTMMRANRLYGVTMEESGVSKIVSVALTDQISG